MKDYAVVILFIGTLLSGLFYHANHSLALETYRIKPGDTMWKISQEQKVDFHVLLNLNKQIIQPELIYPGQSIYLPNQLKIAKQTQIDGQLKLLTLVNTERQKHNLQPLSIHSKLNHLAEKKARDMLIHKYVAHKSPTYGNPTDMLETFHFPNKRVFENIGAGPKSAEEMFETWINTQVNRNNILAEQASLIGIGCAVGGLHQYYWTLLIVEK